ncbi:hypothetical protein KEM52_003920 [Ascosphaera acerosa]|nr:hypothetical protein KEM52_003920 [Ascosphaera acerosa]
MAERASDSEVGHARSRSRIGPDEEQDDKEDDDEQQTQHSHTSSHPEGEGKSFDSKPSPTSTLTPQSPQVPPLSPSSTASPPPDRLDEDAQSPPDADLERANNEADEQEEEEITRCVCGSQDYPGLPGIYRELLSKGELPGHPAMHLPPPAPSSSHRRNASKAAQSAGTSAAPQPEDENDLEDIPDPGSLFIQCDGCKVWQHGGCVGIMDEGASPDEYYCERCRGDLHRIVIDGKGHRSSRYIPVVGDDAKAMSPLPSPLPPSRERSRSNTTSTAYAAHHIHTSSTASARDRRTRNRESRELRNMQDVNAPPLHASGPTKKRSTMNSRDAAYDVVSRRESGAGIADKRRSKRSRSGDEQDDSIYPCHVQQVSYNGKKAKNRLSCFPIVSCRILKYSTSSKALRVDRDLDTDEPVLAVSPTRRQQGRERAIKDEDADRTASLDPSLTGALSKRKRSPQNQSPWHTPRAGGEHVLATAEDSKSAVKMAGTGVNGKKKKNNRGRNQYTRERDRREDAIASGLVPDDASAAAADSLGAHQDSVTAKSGLAQRGRSSRGGRTDNEDEDDIEDVASVTDGVRRSANASAKAHLTSRSRPTTAHAHIEAGSTASGGSANPVATAGPPADRAAASAIHTAPSSANISQRPPAAAASSSGAAPLQHSSRVSMNDMRRRVSALLEFISRTQLDMAANGEKLPSPPQRPAAPPNAASNGGRGKQKEGGGGDQDQDQDQGQDQDQDQKQEQDQEQEQKQEVPFEQLSTFEMMDHVTRGLLKWQQEYGKFGDR